MRCSLPLLACLAPRLASQMGLPPHRVRRLPLAVALLYLHAALQADGVETRWSIGSATAAERQSALERLHALVSSS